MMPASDKIKKIIFGIFVFFFLSYFLFLNAPADFPVPIIVRIEEGMNLRNVSVLLKREHIIRSQIVFEAFIIMYGREKYIISSDYYFENKLPVYEVARRLAKGEHHMAPIAVTIPEGFNIKEISEVFALKLVNFNESKFLSETKELEGYLFPDTYFFLTTDNEEDVIKSMNKNFEKKMLSLRPEITLSGNTEKKIITMASIIEREAKGDADRGLISGILWKRFNIDMPLQVDAAPETYKTKGLPKNPIGNPGLEALKASIHPQDSKYLYYLHDKEGNIHYARTFAEHLKNKSKYLK